MKRSMPFNESVDVILSDDSSSDVDTEVESNSNTDTSSARTTLGVGGIAEEIKAEDIVMKRAEMYQQYMKQVPIPTRRGSVIPFNTWMGLAKSIKQLYNQPLHYLTNILVKQWDQLRIGDEDEDRPLDTIIHPSKAEANIWLIEEVHRQTTSSHRMAKLWLADPMHYNYVDSILPQLYARP